MLALARGTSASGYKQTFRHLVIYVRFTPERCYEAEGRGLMLLLPFNGDLKERYDDGYFCNDFQ